MIRAESATLSVTCTACGQHVVIMQRDFAERPCPDRLDIVERGITCPACGAFHHAAWDSASLKATREAIGQARGRWRNVLYHQYQAAFKRLQQEMNGRPDSNSRLN